MIPWIIAFLAVCWMLIFAVRLRQWERQLRQARIAIAFKGRVKMSPPLFEWLMWANEVAKDDTVTGRTVYKVGGTTVAILKPRKGHGKTKTKTIKENVA